MSITRTLLAASMCAAALCMTACHDNDRRDDRDRMDRNGRMTDTNSTKRWDKNTDGRWDKNDGMMMKPTMVSMNELPASAQSGLRREAMGGQVMNTGWMKMDNMKVYTGETMMDGTTYKICVDENGKLVHKGRADMMDKMMNMQMDRMNNNVDRNMDRMNNNVDRNMDRMNRDMR